MKTTRLTRAVALTAAALAAVAGCSSGGSSAAGGTTTVNWWTWSPDQAIAYQQCVPAFEKAHPDIKVKISNYNVSDYFTKLTSGFVSGDAPDAFMNSVTFLQSYAGQGQLLAIDDYLKKDNLDLGKYAIGAEGWKYKDGKQYALPMDWATGALYYNKDLLAKAGYTDKDVAALNWTHTDGGTFWKMIKHLTVDTSGKRGDQPGFNPAAVKTYGLGNLESTGDPFGQNAWGWLLPNDGINIPDKPQWATVFNYNDPKVVQSVQLVRKLTDDGYTPKLNQFTTANSQQVGSGKVAMVVGGTWEAATYAGLKGTKVGTAPLPAGADGKRALMTNANGNNLWAGSKHPDQTWKWVSYQESEECQTTAAKYNASFFPSIAASMKALADQQTAKGTDFTVFNKYLTSGELVPCPVYNNGAALTNAMTPQFESYFTNKADDGIFAKMQDQSRTLLAEGK
ncbi:sugar ABC transporter substrate-binding protein [Kribbella sp.]|uniref:ABC transporter substrate-binding protein n=1 Tax=Kribbella sp. TaxID=1871183 RepID=UPI002D5F7DC7|nr:sugar ABC transporter substrate-binding protein [Kribbella sp.]HZX01462.1 sugar ABC transporter substrate-binding protein [Kribbella sp.]